MARTRAAGQQVGDLFVHFGVEVAARPAPPAAIVEGVACPACGWLVRRDQTSCSLCGEIFPPPQPIRC